MNLNAIKKYRLELRARELYYDNKTEHQIADILTKESGHKISRSSVHRYFADNKYVRRGIAERDEIQKGRTAELILDTVQARHEIIKELRDLAMQAKNEKDIKTALMGLDRAVSALDSLDRRLGRFVPDTQVNVMQVTQQVQQAQDDQFNVFMKAVLQEVDNDTKSRITAKLNAAIDAESRLLA